MTCARRPGNRPPRGRPLLEVIGQGASRSHSSEARDATKRAVQEEARSIHPGIFTGRRHEAVEVAVDPALTDRSPTQACSPHVEEGEGEEGGARTRLSLLPPSTTLLSPGPSV